MSRQRKKSIQSLFEEGNPIVDLEKKPNQRTKQSQTLEEEGNLRQWVIYFVTFLRKCLTY